LIEDGKTGLLVSQCDPKGLADAIVRILNDEHLRHYFSENGRAKVEDEFNVRKNAARLMSLFHGKTIGKSEPCFTEKTQ
jgi:glycosyltransferase involved in cell wall biosynthesis